MLYLQKGIIPAVTRTLQEASNILSASECAEKPPNCKEIIHSNTCPVRTHGQTSQVDGGIVQRG